MKKPSPVLLSLIAVATLALILFGSIGFSIRARSTAELPAMTKQELPPTTGNGGPILEVDARSQAPAIGPQNGAASTPPASGRKENVISSPGPALQPLVPVIRNGQAPVVGRAEMVPGHFEGVMVSHVPLSEPPPVVPAGTPRTPPTVIHPTPAQGGGTLYLLDSTWDIPVQAPPVTSAEKAMSPASPTLTR